MRQSILTFIDRLLAGPMRFGIAMDGLPAVLCEAIMARPEASGAGHD
ncbi:hypothetical protein HBN77_16235 [Pseudomonas sp. WS 5018]|nr:hypothetical protein [Pseudomonas sp. WS 5018]